MFLTKKIPDFMQSACLHIPMQMNILAIFDEKCIGILSIFSSIFSPLFVLFPHKFGSKKLTIAIKHTNQAEVQAIFSRYKYKLSSFSPTYLLEKNRGLDSLEKINELSLPGSVNASDAPKFKYLL
uniref:Uncharacterized protein n=1 Tax=Cacopsylla melanoneura TaxID=428564 RepID=A0A8D8LFR1_9HEMI